MYGPRQKYVDPFKSLIPKWYQCNHTLVSGRHCTQTVTTAKSACKACQPINGSERYCEECFSMLRAFGLKP